MKHSYLELTYRKGRPLAAYYYLPRQDGDTSVRAEKVNGGLVVDFAADGRAMGIEITAPTRLVPHQLNELLTALGYESISPKDLAPLAAA